MNKKKFCFIICTNNTAYFEECLAYLQRLSVPEGYEIQVLGITEAKSMAAGYNEGMQESDATYKIYLHQDVYIIYPFFLQALLDIFESDEAIGMIGMVGTEKMSPDAVMWYGYRRGALYGVHGIEETWGEYAYQLTDGLHEAQAVDGFLIATSKDIPWREDVFDGWDFYDVSQSFEMRRKGYKVVIPEQKNPWCLHDDGLLNLRSYDKYRRICMKEYPEYFED